MRRMLILAICAALGIVLAVLVGSRREHLELPQDASTTDRMDHVRAGEAVPTKPPGRGTNRSIARGADDGDVIGSTDPTAKDYDPVMLNRVMNIPPSELMNKEPRDAAFATLREQSLRDRITERLRKRITYDAKVGVECHTSSCEVTIENGKIGDDLNSALQAIDLSRLSEAVEVGPMTRQGVSRQRGMSIIMLFSADMRDPAAYDRVLRQHEAHDEQLFKAP